MNATAIHVPIQALNPDFIQQLQERYPNAQVTVHTEQQQPTYFMNEAIFWEIISLFDWGRKKPQDIIAPAVLKLSNYQEEDIFGFEEILAQKLHNLDTEIFAAMVGWGRDEPFSTDGFLYARCAVVANGKEKYTEIVNKSAHFPKNISFETILYLAEQAYKMKTGRDDYDYLPNISYETFANASGWPNGPRLELLVLGSPENNAR